MLATGRLDWTLGYSEEMIYNTHATKISGELDTISIVGNEDLIPIYSACPKSPLGRKVITAINRSIEGAGRPPTYRDYYMNWIDSAARADLINKAGRRADGK
jgi:uncharacterized protein (TIGR02285 family)